MRGVLELVREKSGWGTAAAAARAPAWASAFYYSHRGYFAEVVQATVAPDGVLKVDKVWVGRRRRQPDHQSERRRESGAGLRARRPRRRRSARRSPSRTAARCRANFNDFPLLRINQAPPVEVHFRKTDNPPTGLGEPALPPVIPALCNAIFAATGKRVRRLPIEPATLARG